MDPRLGQRIRLGSALALESDPFRAAPQRGCRGSRKGRAAIDSEWAIYPLKLGASLPNPSPQEHHDCGAIGSARRRSKGASFKLGSRFELLRKFSQKATFRAYGTSISVCDSTHPKNRTSSGVRGRFPVPEQSGSPRTDIGQAGSCFPVCLCGQQVVRLLGVVGDPVAIHHPRWRHATVRCPGGSFGLR